MLWKKIVEVLSEILARNLIATLTGNVFLQECQSEFNLQVVHTGTYFLLCFSRDTSGITQKVIPRNFSRKFSSNSSWSFPWRSGGSASYIPFRIYLDTPSEILSEIVSIILQETLWLSGFFFRNYSRSYFWCFSRFLVSEVHGRTSLQRSLQKFYRGYLQELLHYLWIFAECFSLGVFSIFF